MSPDPFDAHNFLVPETMSPTLENSFPLRQDSLWWSNIYSALTLTHVLVGFFFFFPPSLSPDVFYVR